MFLSHVLMPILVLHDYVSKFLDSVFLIVEYFLYNSWVYGLRTSVQVILKHKQHGIDPHQTTNVLIHFMYTKLQVIFSGILPELLHILIDL